MVSIPVDGERLCKRGLRFLSQCFRMREKSMQRHAGDTKKSTHMRVSIQCDFDPAVHL
jgi:hypothetical protein